MTRTSLPARAGTSLSRTVDEAYCCRGCALNGPCICTYEQDLADDGVNSLGLPFAVADVAPVVAPEPARHEVPVH